MMTNDAKTTVKRYRRAALGGGCVGLLALAAYFGYDYAMTPARPDLPTASARDVVAYISSDRGLPKLPQIEEQQFLLEWRFILAEFPEKREELKACFSEVDDQQRKAFSEAMFKHFKRAFLEDAKRFLRTSKEQKYAFLRKKVAEYRDQAGLLKDLAVGFKKQFTGRQDDVQKWIIEHTTADERAVAEPYVDALKSVREQVRKEERAPTSAPSDTAAPES